MSSALIVPAVMAAITQGIQAWMLMARMNGLDETELKALLDEQYVIFRKKLNTPLPDPDGEEGC